MLTQKEIAKQICPAGKIKCIHYKYYEDNKVHEYVHLSNHRCKAVKRELYIHDFELCPFPSKKVTI